MNDCYVMFHNVSYCIIFCYILLYRIVFYEYIVWISYIVLDCYMSHNYSLNDKPTKEAEYELEILWKDRIKDEIWLLNNKQRQKWEENTKVTRQSCKIDCYIK